MNEHNHDCECGQENCNCNEEHEHCGCEGEHENCNCGCDHENCDCGCQDDDLPKVTLTLTSGKRLECAVLTIYEAEGNEYIALYPVDEENQDENVYIYNFKEVDGKPTLSNIETDKEYLIAMEAFDKWFDEQDIDYSDYDDEYDDDEDEYEE